MAVVGAATMMMSAASPSCCDVLVADDLEVLRGCGIVDVALLWEKIRIMAVENNGEGVSSLICHI